MHRHGRDSSRAAKRRWHPARPWGDDRLESGGPNAAGFTQELWRATIRRRLVGIGGLAVTAAAVPSVGPDRFKLALLVLAVGVAYNLSLQWAFVRYERVPRFMAYADMLACVGFVLVAPTTFVPALLVMLTATALAATTVGGRHAMAASAFGTVAVAGAAFVVRPPDAALGVIALAVVSAMAAATVGAVADNERRVRARYGALVEGLDGIVWEGDPDTLAFTYVSPRAEAILGYPVDSWYEEGFWQEHIVPEDRERAVGYCVEAMAEGRDHAFDYRMVAADGRVVHVHDIVAVTSDQSGRPVTSHGMILDVTDRKRAERRVQQYADIVETIQVGLVVARLDERGDERSLRLIAANPAASEALHRPLERWTGQPLAQALPVLEGTDLPARLAAVVRTGVAFQMEGVLRPGTPGEVVLAVRAFPLPDEAVGVSLEDVTAATRAAGALRRQALHDGLTGLPNRALLKDRLTVALAEAARAGRSVALLVMDLDQFKEVNDALGHHVGDLMLVRLAERLGERLRDADVIARLGGDEFAVLLTTDVSLEGAVAVAQRVQAALLEPFDIDDLRLQTNASIGIAVYPDHATDADALTQRADVAMYQAKRTGSGHAVYRAELDRSSVRRLTLLGDFRRALESDEFVLHFQPVMDVASARAVRAEALVRWQHPEHGLLQPEDFIELAEVSGFIQPLTRWVLERALASASSWWAAGHHVGVAVNLSVRNLYDPGLPEHLRTLLAASLLPASELMLEVTETELMDDPGLALDVLGEVHRMGVATGVDDFGTGYSSLTYLRNLPIREIKIDRSFVSGMRVRSDDLTIVRSTIDLGHNLSLDVVAEGVEDELTLLELGTLGCDLAQGYHLSRPMPLDAFHAWLAAQALLGTRS